MYISLCDLTIKASAVVHIMPYKDMSEWSVHYSIRDDIG